MSTPLSTEQLRQELIAHLDTVQLPPADFEAVLARVRRRRVRRMAGPALLTAAAVGVGALVLLPGADPAGDRRPPDDGGPVRIAAERTLELDEGLRAFASPGERLYLGGTSIELTPDLAFLDTDAVATPYGLVYTDPDGRVHLLGEDGTSEPISRRSDVTEGWHPTTRVDASRPHVAFATLEGQDVALTVYDLEERAVVATTDITCADGCADLTLEAIDSGVVFVRTSSGTAVWDYEGLESFRFAGRETRIADARNRVVLYTGPEPSQAMEGWRYVRGEIDATLSYDGEHVLYWSATLEPTAPDGEPLTLDLPGPATFFAFDTDGSVLAATVDDPSTVYDCELPDGPCATVGEMSTTHGDPVFMGADS